MNSRTRDPIFQNSDDQINQSKSREPNIINHQLTKSLIDVLSQSETGTICEPNEDNCVRRHMRISEARARRTALLACAIFCAAWGPYASMAILSEIGIDYFINEYTTAVLGLFTKTAACINPLLFALSTVTFRQQIYFCMNNVYTARAPQNV